MSLVAPYALAFGLAAIATIALTPLLKRIATFTGIVARPTGDRWNRTAVPLLGGVAIYLGTASAILVLGVGDPRTWWILGAGTFMVVVGLVDDIVHLKPSAKLLAQLLVACVFQVSGLHTVWFAWPLVDALISIFWVIAITNAFNLLDNMDGLCAGTAAVASLAFAAAIAGSNADLATLAVAVAGAAVGFLCFNFHPATIFMGDAGSLFIGVTLAGLSQTVPRRDTMGLLASMAFPVVLLSIPLFDTLFVTVSRKLSARKASVGGRDHTSHRLVALGFPERTAVLFLYGFAIAGGVTAFMLTRSSIQEASLLTGLLTLALVLLGVRLARVNAYGDADFALLRNRAFTPLLVDFTYKRRVFELLLDLALAGFAYYAAFVVRFGDTFWTTYYGPFVTSLPVIIAGEISGLYIAGVYRGTWRHIGISDLATYGKGIGLGTLLSVIAMVYLTRFEDQSRGVFVINAVFFGVLVVGARLSFRLLAEFSHAYRQAGQPALIYGAGDGGALAVRELRNNLSLGYRPVAFIDDDWAKHGRKVGGLPVVGASDQLGGILATTKATAVILTTRLEEHRLRLVQEACADAGADLLRMHVKLDAVTDRELESLPPAPAASVLRMPS